MRNGSKQVRGGWQQWTEAEARGVLAELDSSGLSVAAFARARGVSQRRIAYWRVRVGAVRMPAFVPVEVAPTATVAAMISVEVQGVVVRVREEIAVAKLVEIVVGLAGRERAC
jgi:hypothetical protein